MKPGKAQFVVYSGARSAGRPSPDVRVVEGGEYLLAQIHDVNSRLPVVRVTYLGRSVFLGVDFPALPFRAEHLTQAVTLLAQFADDVLENLRLPGEPATVRN